VQGVGNFTTILPQNWLLWERPLGIGKTGPDQENSRKYLPFGDKIVKIGSVDTEIALLIVKKEINEAKYIALPASLSGLKKLVSAPFAVTPEILFPPNWPLTSLT